MKTFHASLDLLSKIITSLIAIIAAVMLFNYFMDDGFIYIFTGGFLMALIIFMFLYMPQKYIVSKEELIIKRIIGDFKVERKKILKVIHPDRSYLSFVVRVFGNGGLFGYTGYFWNKSFGKMHWFVTQRKNYVVIDMGTKRKIVLSPDDYDGLIDALQNR